ncbi:MAG: hypothetical protein HY898_26175 [Deltaproteobacteria bacterium]|nr:hypothetical protein [Deltaproteobacteria bacterium]
MNKRTLPALALLASLALLSPATAHAHCDTMSGPVISAARAALDSGNVNLVLIWVQPGDEGAVRDAFNLAKAARAASGSGKDAADQRFFETLVRVHRAGEGAPFEGIKPADADVGPAIPAADKAIATGAVDEVGRLLNDAVNRGLQQRYQSLQARKAYDPNDLAAGRAYVKSYVEYTHYVEGLYETAAGPSAHHEHAAGDRPHQHDAHHGGHAQHLPWLLAGLLGLVAIGEGGWLMARRKRGS